MFRVGGSVVLSGGGTVEGVGILKLQAANVQTPVSTVLVCLVQEEKLLVA